MKEALQQFLYTEIYAPDSDDDINSGSDCPTAAYQELVTFDSEPRWEFLQTLQNDKIK